MGTLARELLKQMSDFESRPEVQVELEKIKDQHDIEESGSEFDFYNNNKGASCNVYSKGSGFYATVASDEDGDYDMEFKNKSELTAWLKKEKFEYAGSDED